ncbi:hypothetical protein HLB23_16260 [Nocardia uniformis]|uniref:DUF5709 domain-containing protein n=1 Tax=Nocardia uniformis TaxID=53432 RepID=A0A849C971_9NOCA|nr:hypothetical protein [Nocardia uniformis]NNH71399.1 hypothetical protein [Nocardia uniformis]
MSEPNNTYDPPQDTGEPDSVETDPGALSSAEDLDEDRLRQDPHERGMDPPEHWSGATKYGMTPWEQAHPQPLAERLDEEQPDFTVDIPPRDPDAVEPDSLGVRHGAADLGTESYEEELGIAADIAGGSVPQEIREPSPPE